MIGRLVIGALLMVCVVLALSGCAVTIVRPTAAGPVAGPNPCNVINCNTGPRPRPIPQTGRIA